MPEATAKRALNALGHWPRGAKQALFAMFDGVLLLVAVWVAFALRLGDLWPDGLVRLWWLVLAAPVVGVPVLWLSGLYREVTRHTGPRIVWQAGQAVGVVALALAALTFLAGEHATLANGDRAPRSMPFIFLLVALGLVAGSRSLARQLLRAAAAGERERVVVWGAGPTGARLVSALLAGNRYRPIAIVDDDLAHVGARVRGVSVHDARALPELLAAHSVTHVLLAVPEADRVARRSIIERVTRHPVTVRSVPSMDELVSGRAGFEDMREVPVEDLLGREPVPPDAGLLSRCVRGKSVLVTGAGGSIGAELARQALLLEPARLVLFERSEHALYQIEQELRQSRGIGRGADGGAEIIPILGSVLDRDRLERTMRTFGTETVYHAAAFKHVPMVELNVAEGIENNTLGTLVAAETALAAEVETFVLISTDKAVRPTSVMGASKRLAELILQALAIEATGATVFSMVRFGNVLGSSGSVVPLFREQIARGGPVTVTHPDVIRYFMTIPEAAQLVMQAGAMAEGGEVFLLDMGEPVRIAELAERMIRLAGRTIRVPQNDDGAAKGEIEIKFTGLRPGEKLFEELLIAADAIVTGHPRVRMARERSMRWDALQPLLDRLSLACRTNDIPGAIALLVEAVPEYAPAARPHDLLWDEAHSAVASD